MKLYEMNPDYCELGEKAYEEYLAVMNELMMQNEEEEECGTIYRIGNYEVLVGEKFA